MEMKSWIMTKLPSIFTLETREVLTRRELDGLRKWTPTTMGFSQLMKLIPRSKSIKAELCMSRPRKYDKTNIHTTLIIIEFFFFWVKVW